MGCPRQHKSYARYPTRQGSGVSFGGFFSAERWGTNRFSDGSSAVIVGFGCWVTAILPLYCLPFYPGVFRPLSTALSRSLPGLEGLSVIITLGRSFCCQGKKEAGTQTHQPQREFSSRWGSCVVVYVPAQKPYSVRPSNGIFSLTYRTGVCQYRLERFLQVVQCLSSA